MKRAKLLPSNMQVTLLSNMLDYVNMKHVKNLPWNVLGYFTMKHVGLHYRGYARSYYHKTGYFTMKRDGLRYHGYTRLYNHETR
jgi:hypothetical protein